MLDSSLSKDALAHLEVMTQVTMYIRSLGLKTRSPKSFTLFGLFNRESTLDSELVADLMDAIHNTPAQVSKPFCTTEEYIKTYYRSFDLKHPNSISIEAIFKNYIGD